MPEPFDKRLFCISEQQLSYRANEQAYEYVVVDDDDMKTAIRMTNHTKNDITLVGKVEVKAQRAASQIIKTKCW